MKIDYEVREIKTFNKLNNEELTQLIDKMKKKKFDYEGYIEERGIYSFVRFYKR